MDVFMDLKKVQSIRLYYVIHQALQRLYYVIHQDLQRLYYVIHQDLQRLLPSLCCEVVLTFRNGINTRHISHSVRYTMLFMLKSILSLICIILDNMHKRQTVISYCFI
jgi:hypothetical protein